VVGLALRIWMDGISSLRGGLSSKRHDGCSSPDDVAPALYVPMSRDVAKDSVPNLKCCGMPIVSLYPLNCSRRLECEAYVSEPFWSGLWLSGQALNHDSNGRMFPCENNRHSVSWVEKG
jgi:hypothetical protein